MKKYISIVCFMLFLVLISSVEVSADVIYQPFDDFYENHREECVYSGRSFTAKGPNGDVTVYRSPEDSRIIKEFPNGTELYVSYTYQTSDGIVWACCDQWEESITGWLPMDYLQLIYDETSFSEEYGHLFTESQGTLDDDNLTGKIIRFWQYPGSTECIEIEAYESSRPSYQTVYTDENGNNWGRIGYYMGMKGYWLNLDDPTADYDSIFPFATDVPAPEESVDPSQTVPEIEPDDGNIKMVMILSVCAVVIITGALLFVLKKKRK